jgi:hypothetical protein
MLTVPVGAVPLPVTALAQLPLEVVEAWNESDNPSELQLASEKKLTAQKPN